jgi:cystathionine beta-lyase
VVAVPGVIAGFNAAARTVCRAGEGVLIQPPVYPPFHKVHRWVGLALQEAPLAREVKGTRLQYSVDLGIFKHAINAAQMRTGMFLFCHPHNPCGVVFSRNELQAMADICLENDTVICSDEIHSELLLGEARHLPMGLLSPEVGQKTITLLAPSKTFNIPGLYCAFAILQDGDLLKRYQQTKDAMSLQVSSLGLKAAEAAFSGACDEWLQALKAYLTANRDFLVDFIESELQGVRVTCPQATYLAWLDCGDLIRSGRISGKACEFFLKEGRVAMNDGSDFGSGGEGCVRLNFGCPRKTLEEALGRIKHALK